MNESMKTIAVLSLAVAMLSACGGGGSSGNSDPQSTPSAPPPSTTPPPPSPTPPSPPPPAPAPSPASATITGDAVGSSGTLDGAAISVKDATGKVATGTVGENGQYSVQVVGLTPPLLVQVNGSSGASYGYASALNSVADVTAISTGILQAYYQGQGTTVASAFSAASQAAIPSANQIGALVAPVVSALQPYMVGASVTNPKSFNPLSSSFTYRSTTGFGQVLAKTTQVSGGFKVASPSSTSAGSTITLMFGPAPSSSTPNTTDPNLVAVDATTTATNGVTTSATTVVDLCTAHGTPVPGLDSVYDCVSSVSIVPSIINIVPNATVPLYYEIFSPSELTPSVDTVDSTGYAAAVPNATLNWTSSDPSVIELSSPSTMYWPTLTAHKIGNSTITVTDTTTGATASAVVSGVNPHLYPPFLVISGPCATAGYGCAGGQLVISDDANNAIAAPGGLSISVTPAGIANASFNSIQSGEIDVSAIGIGSATVTVSGFGTGIPNATATVCVNSFVPTQFSGTYTATEAGVAESGTFSGSLTTSPSLTACTGIDFIGSSATLESSLYGDYFDIPGFDSEPPLIPVGTYANLFIPNGAPTTSDLEIAFDSSASDTANANCEVTQWTSGPLAGQPGTVSTGTGLWTEDHTNSGQHEDIFFGNCTVTVQ